MPVCGQQWKNYGLLSMPRYKIDTATRQCYNYFSNPNLPNQVATSVVLVTGKQIVY